MRQVEQVVITGMGVISPLGNSVDSFWERLAGGQSGVSRIESVDTARFKTKIAGAVRGFDAEALFDRRDEVHAAIEAVTQTRTTAAWMARLLSFDLWCGEVLRQEEVPDDPQVKHMDAFTSYQHPVIGEVKTVNVPITLSETPGKVERHAPMVGEHTVEILAELGFDNERIAALRNSGAVWVHPRAEAA